MTVTINKPLGVLCILLLASITPLCSQENRPKAHFSCVVWEDLKLGDIFYLDQNKYHLVTFKRGSRSKQFPFLGDQPLNLFIQENDADGEIKYRLVGKATRPEGSKQILYLIRKNSKPGALPLNIFSMDDGLSKFPRGSFKIVNFTNLNLDTVIGNKRQKVKPTAIQVIRPNIPEKGGFEPFLIANQNKIINETRLYAQRSDRKIAFIFPNKNGNKPISIKYLSQLIAKPVATPPG